MKKNIIIVLITNVLFLTYSCKDYDREPFNDDVAPAQVYNVHAEPMPGGAKITYDIPDDPNLLYVKAVYTLADGSVRESKASFYKNYMILEGFFEAGEYEAKLYSVSRGEKMSAPLVVPFQTEISPIQLAYGTLSITRSYGGISVSFKNDYEANLRFTVLTKDETGEIIQADDYYTASREGRFAVRGYSAEERWFGVFIGDRWNNHTDTVAGLFTPIFEEQVPKPYARVNPAYTSDVKDGHVSSKLEGLWDGLYGNTGNPTPASQCVHTVPGTGFPQHFTFDLKKNVRLSRVKVHHRYGDGYDGVYMSGDPKVYEIWGAPSGAGDDLENWTLLTTCQSVKPSGLPYGTISSEDLQYAGVDGEEFEFPAPGTPEEIPPVQLIRVRFLSVWGTLDYIYLAEMTFYGEIL
ncbi:MAG: DUF4959 domain-containing protein [Prevotella sp.]|jgi:hypothetical protein|nr:DUF4959 domain-containing protein [Prevotella sp.]